MIYSMRIGCPKCSVQQTFHGTPPEIGDAVEMWHGRHQLTAHAGAASAVNGSRLLVSRLAPTASGRSYTTPSKNVSRLVQTRYGLLALQASTVMRVRTIGAQGRPGRYDQNSSNA